MFNKYKKLEAKLKAEIKRIDKKLGCRHNNILFKISAWRDGYYSICSDCGLVINEYESSDEIKLDEIKYLQSKIDKLKGSDKKGN
jgi:transcription initiation factor IIE alpha subunit